MAIPSRQIGWSTKANLLWQISKQLEYLTCVTAGGCGTTTTTSTIVPTTTTTTTIAPLVNTTSTFVDCEGACDAGPCAQPYNYFNVWMTQECIDTFPTVGCVIWLDDKATIPFPNGSYNDGTGIGCIYITNGTISSTPPPVFTDTTFINCPGSCFIGCVVPYDYYAVYMSQACIDSWPTEGCEVWLDVNATEPFPTGSYPSLTGCIDIENGIVI